MVCLYEIISLSLSLICVFANISEYKLEVTTRIPYGSVQKFYNWFFQDVRTLKVLNLIGKNTNGIPSRTHLDHLLFSMADSRKFEISEVMVEKRLNENQTFPYETLDIETTDIKLWNVDESEEKLRKYADFNKGFILVSPSAILALNYFEQRIELRQFYQRDISIVIITEFSCGNTIQNHQIHQLLRTAWKKHGILNILVQTSCNSSHNFFIYRPLVSQNGTYGRLESYILEDILNYPKGILNSLRNLNNISLKVNMFYRYPTAVEVFKPVSRQVGTCYDVLEYSNYIGGIDGCTLGHLAKQLNFNGVIEDIKGQGITRFGHILPNGSLSGSLGDVNQRRTDIAMNGMFLEYKYAFFNLEFSQVDQSHELCLVVPKAGMVPAWASILRVFSFWSWAFIVISGVAMWIYLDLFNSTGYFGNRLVLTVHLFVFHVILAGIFNGHLYRNFSTISYYPDINSLEELAHSDLLIETTLNIFDYENESDIMKKLSRKVVKNYYGTGPAIERAAIFKNIVALERKEEALFKINTKYLDQNGFPMLHVLDECVMTQFISKILPEGSPFLLVFNTWFSRFRESGLSEKWLSSLVLPTKNSSVIGGVSPRLGLDKLVLVFGMLLVGTLLSAVAFLGEIIVHKLQLFMEDCH